MTESPIEILEERLKVYHSALSKSISSFNSRSIEFSLHKKHINNLLPKIEKFEKAISILKKHQNEF